MATLEKSSTASPPLLSSPSSFSCRSPALQQSFGTASPSLSPCPSLNASTVIVLLPDESVRLYEQRISADRVLAEFPNHELRRAGSRRSLDADSKLSSRETYALIDPKLHESPLHDPTVVSLSNRQHLPQSPRQPLKRPPPSPQSEPPASQNGAAFLQPPREFSPTTPPLERARTTSPERSQPAATTVVCSSCTRFPYHVQSAGQLHGRSATGGSGKGAAFGGTSAGNFVHAAEVASRRLSGCRSAAAHQRVFEATGTSASSPEDDPSPSSGRSVDVAPRDRLRSASMSDARTEQNVARHAAQTIAEHELSAGAVACGRATTCSQEECPGVDDERVTYVCDKFATSPESEAEGDDTPGVPLDHDSCCYNAASRATWQHSMASPLLRQSSLTTYLPSTAAAIAGSGGFQAEAASMMRHGAHAAAALSRFPGTMMPFFDSLGSRPDSDATNGKSNLETPAAAAHGHSVRPVPPLLEVPPESLLDTSADLTGAGDSEMLRQSEVRFDAWTDHDAAADVPTPRLPRRRQGYPAGGVRGSAAMTAQSERRGGDASGNGATSGASGGSLVLSDSASSVSLPQTPNAVGLVSESGKELRCASGDGDAEAAEEPMGASERAAVAAAASSARPGFVRQRATSACLDLSSSNITSSSGDCSSGGRAARAGSSLFEEWTDLGGRPPWVAGDSGSAQGKEASGTATERRRPIFHQKTPSGRILQELFDLENGPLDLEFLVSLRTPSRRHYDSPARPSSVRSSPYARRTPTTTPPRPPSSLAPSPSPSPPPAAAAAAASDGPALSDSPSASAPLDSAGTESAVSGAASLESLSPQDSPLASSTSLAAPAAAADDCSVDEEDEAAAAAASAWAAVELVDGSVSPAASVSRGWIASAARSRFISRIASSFNYSSLHGRRGLFGLRTKGSSGNSSSSVTTTTATTGGNGNSMTVIGTGATAAAAAAATGAAVSGKSGSRVGGGTRSLIRRGTMPVVRHGHVATALDGTSDRLAAAAAAVASSEGCAAVHASASDGDISASAGQHKEISGALSGQCVAGSSGCPRSISTGAACSGSGIISSNSGIISSNSGIIGSSSISIAGMANSSSSSGRAASQASMGAWVGPEAGVHDAAWRLLLLQQQKIAMMEEEILQLRQRCRAAGLGSDKARSGGGTVTAAGSSESNGFVLENQGVGGGGASGAVYGGLGQYSAINLRRGLGEGVQARGANTSLSLSLPETGRDAKDGPGGSESLAIPSPSSSHSTLSWASHAGRLDSSGDSLVSPRFSPRPAVAAMGAAAAAAAAAAGKARVSSPSAAGIRHGFRAF